ncbi:MAG: NHL repeat-containing protein [bacterium]|nr:NHL repeat-containing protein [bacterium]
MRPSVLTPPTGGLASGSDPVSGSRPGRSALRVIALALAALLLFGGSIAAQDIPRFRIKEERAREYFQKGLTFYNARLYVAAREFFYKSLDVQPYFHLARRYLGDSYYYSGDWNGALEQWEFLDNVSDGAYPLVRQRSELLRFYLNRYRNPGDYVFLRSITPASFTAVGLKRPVDVGVDPSNRTYILSYESANLLKVGPAGELERDMQGGWLNGFDGPSSLWIQDDRLYVSDYSADLVRVLDESGSATLEFGGSGSGDGQFYGPTGIIATDRAVYVVDSGNHRVQKFAPDGKFLFAFGPDDRGRSLQYPVGIALDRPRGGGETEAGGEVVYVADRDDRRILRYDQDGNYLDDIRSEHLRRPRGLDIQGDRLLIADEESGVWFYDLQKRSWKALPPLRNENDEPVRLAKPFAARMDAYGTIHVADYGLNQVLTLVPRGLRIANLDMRIQRVDVSDFPNVAVFLTLKNRLGDPLRGLSRGDFILNENDRRMGGIRVDNTRPYNRRTSLVITKENTEFFAANYTEYLPVALKGLLDPLRTADRLKIVRVGQQVRNVYEGLERRRIRRVLSEGERTDEPNLGKGLYESLTDLVSELGPRTVVLIVSGKEYAAAYNQYSLQKITQYARANEIQIDVISFEGDADPDARAEQRDRYMRLAADTGGVYYRGFDETALANLYETIRARKDERYVLTYSSALSRELSGRYVDLNVQARYLGTAGLADAGFFIPE